MKQNKPQDYEPLNVYLTPTHTPIAYKNKVECLKLAGHSEREAQQLALEPIELELYYETGHGLFAVESDAVESSIVCSPYTREDLEDEEQAPDKEQEVKAPPL